MNKRKNNMLNNLNNAKVNSDVLNNTIKDEYNNELESLKKSEAQKSNSYDEENLEDGEDF